MAWIESHDDIWEHHKLDKFCELLGVDDVSAVGHLHSLWHFVLRNAWRDADLEQWGDRGIEKAARWRGEPGKMVSALRDSEFLDGFVVHDWMDRAGRLVADRLRKEGARRKTKPRQKADKRRTKGGQVPDKLPHKLHHM